jgi:hypothetical protein
MKVLVLNCGSSTLGVGCRVVHGGAHGTGRSWPEASPSSIMMKKENVT